jgi:ADP-heptose:LPS heptosyltransferase
MRYLVGKTDVPDPHVDLYPTTEEVERGWALSRQPVGRPWVLHAIRASLGVRSWPMGYVETLTELAADSGMGMVLVDPMQWPTTERLAAAGAVNLTGRTNVTDLLCLAAASSVVVAPDTGVVHLANAINKRCVTYFTTVPPAQRLKHARWVRALWPRELDCLGCIHTPTCGLPDPKPCAMAVAPEDVLEEIRFVLANTPPWSLEAPRNWARPLRTGSRWLGTTKPATMAAVGASRLRVTNLAGR